MSQAAEVDEQEVVTMSDRERSVRRRMRDNLELYSRKNLKIRPKGGSLVPLLFNRAQRYIHELIEDQLKRLGRVRVIILKGRQQGCSTYVEARFYHKVTHRKGVRAFILTHDQKATDNLFEMAERFYENSNPLLKPHLGVSNAKELSFDLLDSGYRVGTANNKGEGRSQTIQYFHGSEVAFWPNAQEHAKGILQAIADDDDTEVILESTANGFGNLFHVRWKQAESGESEYLAIFIPWYWQPEYQKAVPAGFTRLDEEEQLAEAYGLTDEQLAWRRQKILDLSVNGADGAAAFKQEYPCNPAEAFQTTGSTGLITPVEVMKARKAKVKPSGAYVVGVDPSRGGDRFSTIKRAGRRAWDVKSYTGDQVDALGKKVAICVELLDTVDKEVDKKPDMMFIDSGGGADLVDRLHELGYEDRVKAVDFGGTKNLLFPKRYKNKRGEIWGQCKLWLTDENLDVQIPDSDTLHADLCASPYYRDSMDRIVLKKKEDIISDFGFSPDEGDALALTFTEPVRPKQKPKTHRARHRGSQNWMGN